MKSRRVNLFFAIVLPPFCHDLLTRGSMHCEGNPAPLAMHIREHNGDGNTKSISKNAFDYAPNPAEERLILETGRGRALKRRDSKRDRSCARAGLTRRDESPIPRPPL